MMAAYGVGQRDFGENYVQELVEKGPQLPEDVHGVELARLLGKGYSPDAIDDESSLSALCVAAIFEQSRCESHWLQSEECTCAVDMMEQLLAAGASVSQRDGTPVRNSALHHVCIAFSMGL